MSFEQVELDRLKTAFIYQMTKHINWPDENEQDVFKIAVYGEPSIHTEFYKLSQLKKIGTKDIILVKVKSVDDIDNDLQIIFVPKSHSSEIKSISIRLSSIPCVIISENEGSLKIGSMLNFIKRKNKLKFELNSGEFKRKKIKLSNQLLEWANI